MEVERGYYLESVEHKKQKTFQNKFYVFFFLCVFRGQNSRWCACVRVWTETEEWGQQSAQLEESKVNNTLLDECRNLWITETESKCKWERAGQVWREGRGLVCGKKERNGMLELKWGCDSMESDKNEMFFVDSTNCATHEWSFDSIWEMFTGFGACLWCLCRCRMKWNGKINICHTTDEQTNTYKLEQLKIAYSCNIARSSELLQCVNWRKWKKQKRFVVVVVVVCSTFPSPFAD